MAEIVISLNSTEKPNRTVCQVFFKPNFYAFEAVFQFNKRLRETFLLNNIAILPLQPACPIPVAKAAPKSLPFKNKNEQII